VTDAFDNRRRGLEEEYFRKHEQELIEKLNLRKKEAEARRDIGARAGVADEEILEELRALGYTPDTVSLLHLVPLIQMAWAEGTVSDRERELIIQAARSRGIESGSTADRQLVAWLTTRPADGFFETTMRVIRAMLQARPSEEREASKRDLLSYLTSIASASGGVLGFGKVADEERELLARITSELERAHGSSAKASVLPSDKTGS